jgi:SAM-dependent methyltransferase
MHEYDQIAEWYVATRSPGVGVPDLAAFARRLAPRARVLDLGCGDGIPISRFLTREGFDVVAMDSSPEMIARYQANFPGVPTKCERAEEADFPAASFEAVVAWGVLFHLSEPEQRDVIRKVADWLKPGGWFLFTSGEVEGTTEGEMNGVTFHYTSLGISEYRDAIERVGMRLEANRHDEWGNYVYVAEVRAKRYVTEPEG